MYACIMYPTYIIQITDHNSWTESLRGFYNINQIFFFSEWWGGVGGKCFNLPRQT